MAVLTVVQNVIYRVCRERGAENEEGAAAGPIVQFPLEAVAECGQRNVTFFQTVIGSKTGEYDPNDPLTIFEPPSHRDRLNLCGSETSCNGH